MTVSRKQFRQVIIRSPEKGQIIVEYVLLMVIAVTISLLLIKTLASRGDEKGLLIKKICEIHRFIGEDIPDIPESPRKNLPKGCP